jgi:hypothetical protein
MAETSKDFPAFPRNYVEDGHNGMTLRDYFAAQVQIDAELGVQYAEALIGRKMPDYASDTINNAMFWADVHARLRFISADAMLRARGM